MSSSKYFDEAERSGSSPLEVKRKLEIAVTVALEDGDYLTIEHETGDSEIYIDMHELGPEGLRRTRVLTSLPHAQAKQLAKALSLVVEKVEAEVSHD